MYPQNKVHLEIKPNAKPVHARPCPAPHIYLSTFKIQLVYSVQLGVLVSQKK